MRYALITGADQGTGYAVARQLLQAGYFVFLGCQVLAHGQQARQQLVTAGYEQALAVALDVADDASVLRAIEVVYQHAPRLHALVNSAEGPDGGRAQPPSTIPLAALRSAFEINYYGVVRVTQAFLPLLLQAPHACIVNVSSSPSLLLGKEVDAVLQPVACCTSAAMLDAWTVLLASELRGTAVKVNSVRSGCPADYITQAVVRCATLPLNGPTGQLYGEADTAPPGYRASASY